jgi:hypothetical protein
MSLTAVLQAVCAVVAVAAVELLPMLLVLRGVYWLYKEGTGADKQVHTYTYKFTYTYTTYLHTYLLILSLDFFQGAEEEGVRHVPRAVPVATLHTIQDLSDEGLGPLFQLRPSVELSEVVGEPIEL